MKLFLPFLIIASTPFASTDLALVSAESEQKEAFEVFDSVQRYLRANSTSEQEDEERHYSNEQILNCIKRFLPKLTGFSYESVKKFAKLHFKMMEFEALLLQRPPGNMDKFIIDSLFTNEFQEKLRTETSLRDEKYIDIALYLVLLEKVGGSVLEAAKEIHNRMKYGLEESSRVEDGQFLLWSHVFGEEHQVRLCIFRSRYDTVWKNDLLKRYQEFFANEEKRRMPGMAETSTPIF